ncbi:ketopantoate reductase family protein [Pararobbsia silviterrae]|uniref:2-dehydropantoate 2-reductase n=1 Tax=Pararobbsia silviterrae TaxID=1792498 RepID=A0A494Y777_9BURK|nr:ketopantoate reductase family protein [Pararobbsia silviterrae]RKP55780.1 ketopantoate reductase family protein [Pararobbsia silviterrae]
MRFLIVGAGALGGYFGARLLDAGRDVTFLLRERRAAQIAKTGLQVRSPCGDLSLTDPPVVLSADIASHYDVIVVGCKAYDLEATMTSFAPAVGPDTVILPLLNGMRHIDALKARFGDTRVLGGLCLISATLDDAGTVLHLSDFHQIVYGELDGSHSDRIAAIEAAFADTNFTSRASTHVLHEMWEKWGFIASLAGITSLMRGTVGDYVAAGAADLAVRLFDECAAISAHNGFAPRDAARERGLSILTAAGSPMSASMAKDIERGARIEGAHLIDDLLARAPASGTSLTMLRVVAAHLTSYEARRAREAASN